ncbi:MAG: SAM-dependent methyltransferase [Clostridia bacterium]|nr:SAM-dependent methyltransferase [Clostridia bacterium]
MHILHPSKEPIRSAYLSERLSAIADRVPKDCVVCDIGSDHGILPLYLLKTGHCRRAIVTDLNRLPLDRAKKSLEDEGVDHLADFYLTDGIEEVARLRPDAYVIAGMGGETIAGILSRGISQLPVGSYFILQPMSREVFLRKFLYENGFHIKEEVIVCENEKSFPVFCVLYDNLVRKKDEFVYKFGEFLPKDKSDDALFYWRLKLKKLRIKKAGKLAASMDVSDEEREEAYLLSLLEETNENI